MSTKYESSELGNISIDNEVIKNIALKAAIDVDGIHEAESGFFGKMWKALSKKNSGRGVKLEFTGGSELKIILNLTTEYGTNIPYAAGIAQENVKNSVEDMMGLTVNEVIVNIVRMQSKKE